MQALLTYFEKGSANVSYHEKEAYALAAEISQLSKDYDYYEFLDTFESEEESVQATYKLLLHEEGVKSLLLFCVKFLPGKLVLTNLH